MEPISLYLYYGPFAFCAVGALLFWISKNKGGATLLAWSLNYALANLFFVWSWAYVHHWRVGVITISAVVAIGCALGWAASAILDWRTRENRVLAQWSIAGVVLVVLPISAMVLL